MRKIFVMLLVGVLVVFFAAPAQANGETNTEDYWLDQYPLAGECYKFEDGQDNSFGVNNGQSVTLNFPAVVLIVKGGNGFNEYPAPVAGTPYLTPDNPNGKPAEVSHWIICVEQIEALVPPLMVCPEGTVPGWLDETGSPTSCVGDEPCPGQIVVDDQCVDVTPEPEVTPTVTNDPELTPPAQLAETGVDKTVLASLALILMIAGASAIGVATRKKD